LFRIGDEQTISGDEVLNNGEVMMKKTLYDQDMR